MKQKQVLKLPAWKQSESKYISTAQSQEQRKEQDTSALT
jgi:hypothetical protein